MKRVPILLLTVALACATAHAATTSTIKRAPSRPQVTRPQPAPDGQRFLFVVDVSAAMRVTDVANRQALFDLIFTGLEGQMRTGDTFGLWLFNDELHAGGFPMQVWEEQNPIDTASLATKYLRDQKYSGKSRPDVLMPRLLKLVKSVRDANILILSDGGMPVEGTPFDTNIAAVYERRKGERTKAQKPFVTALTVRDGVMVSGAVVIAGEYFQLPERTLPSLVQTRTNSTNTAQSRLASTPTKATATAVVEAGAPESTASLNLQPASPVVPPKTRVTQFATRSNAAPASPPVVAVTPPGTNSATAATPVPEPSPPAGSPSDPAPIATAAPTPPAMLVAARETVLPIPADAHPIVTPASVPVTALVTPAALPAGGLSAALLITMGGGLLVACIILLIVVLRQGRTRRQSSVITQSMDR